MPDSQCIHVPADCIAEIISSIEKTVFRVAGVPVCDCSVRIVDEAPTIWLIDWIVSHADYRTVVIYVPSSDGKHRDGLAFLALGCFSNNADDTGDAIEFLLGSVADGIR